MDPNTPTGAGISINKGKQYTVAALTDGLWWRYKLTLLVIKRPPICFCCFLDDGSKCSQKK